MEGRGPGWHLPVPLRHQAQGCRVRSVGHGFHPLRTDNFVQAVHGVEQTAGRPGDTAEMAAHPDGSGICQRAVGLLAQDLDHLAGIDSHRALGGAQAVGGAGVHARIAVALDQPFDRRSRALGCQLPTDLPPTGNALSGRKAQVLRRADRFAEPAFDAFVDQLMGRGQRF